MYSRWPTLIAFCTSSRSISILYVQNLHHDSRRRQTMRDLDPIDFVQNRPAAR